MPARNFGLILFAFFAIAAGTADVNAQNSTLLRTYDMGSPNEEIASFAMSDNGAYLAVGTQSFDQKSLYLFSRETTTPLWKYDVSGPGSITSVALSSDGSYLAASDPFLPDAAIHLFNPSSKIPLWDYKDPKAFRSVAISGDGRYIVAAQANDAEDFAMKIFLFEWATSTLLWTADLAGESYADIAISEDGSKIAVGGRQIYLFDKSSNSPLWTFEPGGGANVSISKDGSYIAAGTSGITPRLYLFNSSSNVPVWTYETAGGVEISADGYYVAVSGGSVSGGFKGFLVFQKDSNLPVRTFSTAEIPVGVAISNAGHMIAGIDYETLYLFNKDHPEPLWRYGGAFKGVRMSGDGNYVVAAKKNALLLFDTMIDVPTEVWVDDDYCPSCLNDGHRWGYDAFASIQRGVTALWNGGNVNVASGTYYEGPESRDGGYPTVALVLEKNKVRIIGENRETTILDSYIQADSGVLIVGNDCELKGLTIRNSGNLSHGVFVAGSRARILDNKLENKRIGVYLSRSDSTLIENNRIASNRTGISSFQSPDAIISNNTIDGNETGILTVMKSCLIKNNLIIHNGIAISADYAEGNMCINNTLAFNDVGIIMYNASSSTVRNCIVWGGRQAIAGPSGNYSVTYSDIEGGWPGIGNISFDPAFVNADEGNFRLKDYSPCIGAGTREGIPDTDMSMNPRPSPAGSSPDMGAYESSRRTPAIPTKSILDLFGMTVGNEWTYDSDIKRRITLLDRSSFAEEAYAMDTLVYNTSVVKEWYASTGTELRLCGVDAYRFDECLPVVWFPASPGEFKETSTSLAEAGYPEVNVRLRAEVMGSEKLSLSFGVVDAYRIHYQFTAETADEADVSAFDWWVAPYIGVIKQETSGREETLASFALHGGSITHDSDADADLLSDLQEIFITGTHYQMADTDGDGCSDGMEALHGRNPLVPDPQGDLNADCRIDLADAIMALRILSDVGSSANIDLKADASGDGMVGVEELIFILQKIARLR